MLSKKVEDALNSQINKEFYSSYLYLAMSAYCETLNFPGMAAWLKVQSQEEWGHGLRIYGFVVDRGGTVKLQSIDKPAAEYGSPLEVFKAVLKHEQEVTASINDLYALAAKESDYATQIMLQWFITEQIEEEKSASDIVELLKMAGEHVIVLDHRLGKRGE